MKIATFNIQNIFHRNTHLIQRFVEDHSEIWAKEFKNLRFKKRLDEKEYSRMRDLAVLLGFHDPPYEMYLSMRRKSGQLYMHKGRTSKELKANYITDWNGWIKLNTTPIHERGIHNKMKVIRDVAPDILVLQEVEDRQTLLEFNSEYLSKDGGLIFDEIVYLETNDFYNRGMGLLAKRGYNINTIRTHVNDLDKNEEPLFDFDLQEYNIVTPSGKDIYLLSTILTEGSVDSAEMNKKRKIQSQKIAEVYNNCKDNHERVAIVGTLNAPSYGDSISPLLKDTDLKDVTRHSNFSSDLSANQELDTLHNTMNNMGINIKQRDYLLVSPELFKNIKNCGLNKKGIWHKDKSKNKMYSSIQKEKHTASWHPLIWAKF